MSKGKVCLAFSGGLDTSVICNCPHTFTWECFGARADR